MSGFHVRYDDFSDSSLDLMTDSISDSDLDRYGVDGDKSSSSEEESVIDLRAKGDTPRSKGSTSKSDNGKSKYPEIGDDEFSESLSESSSENSSEEELFPVCEYCSKDYTKAGMGRHQRYCKPKKRYERVVLILAGYLVEDYPEVEDIYHGLILFRRDRISLSEAQMAADDAEWLLERSKISEEKYNELEGLLDLFNEHYGESESDSE